MTVNNISSFCEGREKNDTTRLQAGVNVYPVAAATRVSPLFTRYN